VRVGYYIPANKKLTDKNTQKFKFTFDVQKVNATKRMQDKGVLKTVAEKDIWANGGREMTRTKRIQIIH
jgi:hypothetical protein